MENSNESMIFVTGASRSGTTMLSTMLDQHSRVAGLKELHCFGDLADPKNLGKRLSNSEAIRLSAHLIARSKRDIWGTIIDEDRDEAGQLWQGIAAASPTTGQVISTTLAFLAARQGKAIPCEQTPRNIFYTDELLKSYSNLKIICIVRDPRDVLASQKNRWKLKRLGGSNIPYSEIVRVWVNYHPFTLSKLWAKAMQLALQRKDHERFYLLRFEDIVTEPECELKKICEFLGIAYEESMLNVPLVGSSHRPNTSQRIGVTQSSLNQWMNSLSSGEVFFCERITEPLMQAFAYPPSAPTSILNPSVFAQVLTYPIHAAGVLSTNPRRAWIQLQAVLGRSR